MYDGIKSKSYPDFCEDDKYVKKIDGIECHINESDLPQICYFGNKLDSDKFNN